MAGLHLGTPNTPEEVLERCNKLLTELQAFVEYYQEKAHRGDYRQKCEYNHFRTDIEQEINQMKKILNSETPPERIQQLVNASNLTYWEALWNVAKQTTRITVLRRHSSPVDIISEGGTKWIKVSTITEKRLLMEMAKQGWDWAGSDDENDDDLPKREDDDLDISLIKMAIVMRNLAKESRIHYRYPQVHFVLARIYSGNRDIDLVLDRIRATGATIETADQLKPALPVEKVVNDMVLDDFKLFTSTVNIDCTLLLAVVSDISHGQVQEEPWFNKNVRSQIKVEEKEQLMLRMLWPAMTTHNLVCTKLAAKRMREIVDTIGTPTEKERTRIFMGDYAEQTRGELILAFQKLSQHPVPPDWMLPVKIVDEDALEKEAATPFQLKVASTCTDINRSVILYGWLSGYTTITSNRTVVKAIEKAVEEYRTLDNETGPDVWVCPAARSLVAKEKDRKVPGES